jgi:hypothetical protein
MLYIERLAEITDALIEEIKKNRRESQMASAILKTPVGLGKLNYFILILLIYLGREFFKSKNNKNEESKSESDTITIVSQNNRTASAAERNALIVNRKAELMTLKQKTLNMMHELLEKEINKADGIHENDSELIDFIAKNIPFESKFHQENSAFSSGSHQ